MSKIITIQDGQTLFDIAIQEYGSIDDVLRLIDDNPEIGSLNTPLYSGQKIKINDTFEVQSPSTQDFFISNAYKVRTGDGVLSDSEGDVIDGGLDDALQEFEDIEDNGEYDTLQAYNEIIDSNGN